MAKEVVNVRLDPEVISSLQMIAESGDVTVSDLIRWGISKVIDEFHNSERPTWMNKPKVEYKARVLSEEQKQEVRIRAQAQTVARVKLQQNHKEEHQRLVRDNGRSLARSLLVRMYYREYRDLYLAARQQQP